MLFKIIYDYREWIFPEFRNYKSRFLDKTEFGRGEDNQHLTRYDVVPIQVRSEPT